MTQIIPLWPMPDKIMVLEVTGLDLQKVMENGISQYPKFDGRWPCISGFKYRFGQLEDISGSKIEEQKKYRLAI